MAPSKRRIDTPSKPGTPRRNGNASAAVVGPRRAQRELRADRLAGRYSLVQLEIVGWIVVAVVALGIRLINVDGAPLQPTESVLAIDSWRILSHEGIQLGPSPLLIYLNTLLFLLLGATDAVARLLPVLVGTAVALSPVVLRHRLGKVGALAAAALQATSPTLIFASRTVDPTILTVGLGLGLVLVAERYLRTSRPWLLYAGAVLIALLLMSGPLAYDLAIILIGFVVVSGSEGVRDSLTTPPGDGDPTALDGGGSKPGRLFGSHELSGTKLRYVAMAFAGTILLVGTGLATNLEGLGVSLAAPLSAWAASLAGFGPHPAWLFPGLLLGYEPFALLFGLGGAVLAFRQRRSFEVFLAWWACIGFLLLVLGDGADPTWNALIVVPLGLLAGSAVDALSAWFVGTEQLRRLAIFSAVACPLIATMLIAFGYVTLPNPVIPPEVALAPPLALLAFAASFAFGYDWRSAFHASAVLAAVCLLAFNVHAAMFLNPGGELNPAEFFTGSVTSLDARRMATDVGTVVDELGIAQQLEGRAVNQTVEVTSQFADPLAWYLKGDPNVEVVSQVTDAPGIAIEASTAKAPRGAYAGELFQYSDSAARPALSFTGLWRWWIYHEAGAPTGTYVKVYVKTQLARP